MLDYNYANFHLGIERKVFHGGVTKKHGGRCPWKQKWKPKE
jgi:hypothetical protein